MGWNDLHCPANDDVNPIPRNGVLGTEAINSSSSMMVFFGAEEEGCDFKRSLSGKKAKREGKVSLDENGEGMAGRGVSPWSRSNVEARDLFVVGGWD